MNETLKRQREEFSKAMTAFNKFMDARHERSRLLESAFPESSIIDTIGIDEFIASLECLIKVIFPNIPEEVVKDELNYYIYEENASILMDNVEYNITSPEAFFDYLRVCNEKEIDA